MSFPSFHGLIAHFFVLLSKSHCLDGPQCVYALTCWRTPWLHKFGQLCIKLLQIFVRVWCGHKFSIHDPMPFLWPLNPCPVLVCSMSVAEFTAFFSRFLQHFAQLDSQPDYTYVEGKGHILLTLIPTALKDQPILKFMNKSYLFHDLINSEITMSLSPHLNSELLTHLYVPIA